MFKSKTTMQNHKRKQSEMNPPTSHNFQTQSKSFSTDMQTTRQVIQNINHPSSALKASFGPSFPYNMPQNSSSSHMQTTRQVINNTNHLSSSFQPAIRPSFLYDMRQNSSSSSSSLQASIGPDVHQNSSSSSSSSSSQSLQSQHTVHEPTLNQSSSLNSLLNQDHDLLSEVEINLADQYEHNLLSEVEIIDVNGNILRTRKMTAKQVYKLKGGEKVLVHVNKDYQLIKNVGGLCSRFMTLILKQPNLCPPDAKDWKECKESCAPMLIAELRWRFCIPQGESVDKVLSAMFSVKHRTVKYRLKQGLYQQAADKLNEANGINRLDAQEKNYTNDELLAALDLLEPPENFLEHQWRVYKSHLRKPIAKTEMELEREQSQQGSSHEVSVSTEGVEELKRI
nr:ribose 5-phosphate isomerase, type A [Tanacetum cinerariifolium]